MTQHAQVVEAARSPWPADTIQMRPLEALVPYASNPRTHSPGQVEQIAASIREWGWTVPILVDDEGGIIAGHGRVLAATLLGVTEVPVVVARGWTEDQKRAYVIADNQLTLNGAWDLDLLQAELGKLQEVGFDMGLLGFDPDDLGAHLGGWDTDLDGHTTDPDDLGGLGAKFTVTFDADNKDAMADVREVVVTYLRENNIVAAVA